MENIYTKFSRGKYLKSFHEANLIFVSREIHYTFCFRQFSRTCEKKLGFDIRNNLLFKMNLTPPEIFSIVMR